MPRVVTTRRGALAALGDEDKGHRVRHAYADRAAERDRVCQLYVHWVSGPSSHLCGSSGAEGAASSLGR